MTSTKPNLVEPQHILIVDDDEQTRYLLGRMLEDMGDIATATNVTEALAAIDARQPDLILLDVKMPGGDGFKLCSTIKQTPVWQDIPILFITARPEAEIQAFEVGAVDFIAKPFNMPVVRARVRTQLALKARTYELHQAQIDLRKNHDLLANLIAQVPGMIYQYQESPDGHSYFPFVSKNSIEVCGIDPETLQQDAAPLLQSTHPDDIGALFESMQESKITLQPWRHECRIFAPGKGLIWMQGEAVPEITEDGGIIWNGYLRDITQRKQTLLALEETEQLLRLFIEYVPAGILMLDRNMNHLAVSRRFAEDYCVDADDIIGRNHYEVFPDIPDRWREIHRRGLAGESLSNDNDVYIHPDGKMEWVRWVIKPWYSGGEFGGIVLFAEFITARKKAEEALHLTKFSIDKAVDPLLWISPNSRIHYANEAACRHLGYSHDTLLQMSVFDIDPEYSMEESDAIWSKLREQKYCKFERIHLTKDGTLIPVEVTTNHIEYDGQEYNLCFVRDISERKKSEEVIWRQANYDDLTGLPSRRLFFDRIEQAISKSQRSGTFLAVLFLDLDHFKHVNDTLGHAAGDSLLQTAASRITDCVRRSDTVARFGGDEFTVILTGLTETESVERIATDILKSLSMPYQFDEESVYVSASIGITFYPNDAIDSASLMRNADQAMYAAKNLGRNRYCYYDPAMQEAALTRHLLIKHLYPALKMGQFRLVYQPIVELATGAIFKAEALLRWQHPEIGLIGPDEFIPLAEQNGMIVEIGDWVFREAAQMTQRLRKNGHRNFQVSINKSPMQFRNGGNVHKTWLKYLNELGLSGDAIAIEITENILMGKSIDVNEKLVCLRNIGMQLSLDDFGTGYSSLSYLKRFDIDYLKIDRSFVKSLAPDSEDMALCEAIITMAHKLGMKVIAEGIETREQLKLLSGCECDFMQGYLFSRPVPEEEFIELLNKGPFLSQMQRNI